MRIGIRSPIGHGGRLLVALAVLIALVSASPSALAGTNVSGPIISNTLWSVAAGPYTVTGDVTVDTGAVLTIEAGVTVYMNAGTNLVVKNGGLTAQGTQALPITITSYRDVTNPNPAPAPGDWGRVQFQAGTISASTQLLNVAIRYGSGVTLVAASPTLNNVSIVNHSAPAISTDLQSSPTGSGLVATGNTINGIQVPAGDITGNVTWGLTGIPYVVSQGVVAVGAPSMSVTPTTLALAPNTTGPLHVTLANPAPAGGTLLSVTSATPAVATVPATVLVPASASAADVVVTGVAVGSSTITISAAGLGSVTATAQVSGPLSIVVPANLVVAPTLTAPLAVQLSAPAPAGGVNVTLQSANTGVATVTTPVNIAAGAVLGSANVTGGSAGSTQITASATGYASATTAVTVSAITLDVQPSGTINVPQGVTLQYQVRLSTAAPAGGLVVNLASANTGILTVSPSSVTVAQGQNLSTGPLSVTGVATGSTNLVLSSPGFATKNVAVNVLAQGSLAFSITTATVGKSLQTALPDVAIQLKSGSSLFATPVPVTVALTSANTSFVGVPATVTIPAGLSSANFQVTGVDITSAPVSVSASGAGFAAAPNMAVSVVAPLLSLPGLHDARTVFSPRDSFSASFLVAGGTGGPSRQVAVANTTIQLFVTDQTPPGIVPAIYDAATGGNVITQLTIPSGQSGSNTSGYLAQPTTTGSYTVTAVAPGLVSSVSTVKTVYAPKLQFNFPFMIVGKSLKTTSDIPVFLIAGTSAVASATDVVVSLTSSDPTKVLVPATITIPAGSTSTTFSATGVELTTSAVLVSGSAAGYQSPTPISTTVVTPQFNFSGLAGTRTLQSPRNSFTAGWNVPGNTLTNSFQLSTVDTVVSISATNQTPAGVVSGFYDQATGGNLINSLTIRAGANLSSTSAWIAQPTVPGTYTVTGSVAGLTSSTSTLQTINGPTLTMFGNRELGQGLYQDVPISRSGDTLAPLTVNLSCQPSTLCSVTPTFSFAAGVSSGTVRVTGVDLGSGFVQATAPGYVTGTGGILGRAAVLGFSNLPTSLTVNGNANFTVTVSLGPGEIFGGVPAANIVVDLVSTSPAIASVPASTTIPAGSSNSPSLQLHGIAPGTTKVGASSAGYTGVTSPTITVGP